MTDTELDPAAFSGRRARLAGALGDRAALVMGGRRRIRNYPASTYPFRASSHLLYLFGPCGPDAAAVLEAGRWTLFLPPQAAHDVVWEGERPTLDALAARVGCAVRPRDELPAALRGRAAMTLPAPDEGTAREQSALLGREVVPGRVTDLDVPLAQAMLALRLRQDDAAVAGLRAAAEASVAAHRAGMRATRDGGAEWQVRAAMVAELLARRCGVSYEPIVTVHGEFLHMESSDGGLHAGELLLADVGAETAGGWAGDITRTWPVAGQMSPTQRAAYDVVLAARRAALAVARPGARWRDVHLAAARAVAAGLVDLGILSGHPSELLADGAVAMFLPHGVGHLLGLDVHDMEDLGDLCGYPPGRERSRDPVLRMLRLDRDLEPGMAVTVEPGIYFNPHLLHDPDLRTRTGDRLDEAALARFADVRGIRVEDDVLITAGGHEVLTAALPTSAAEVEALVGQEEESHK